MKTNTRRYRPPRRARRRPELPLGAAAAAVARGVELHAWNFHSFDDVPVVVHADELWTMVDLRFLRQFGGDSGDRLAAIVADGRICVAARPWFQTDEKSRDEVGLYTDAIATRRWNGTLLVDSRLPRYCSELGARFPNVLNTIESLVIATVSGNVS